MPHIAALRARIAPARFEPYVAAAGSETAALRLYEWNIAVSAAYHESLGQLEVVLRNGLDEQLRRWHRKTVDGDGSWHADPRTPLHPDLRQQVAQARSRLRARGGVETHDRVVAELMLGFWRYLLDARHQPTLWAPALRHAFPHLRPRVRTEVYDRLVPLHALRNRIAHHEPIHHLPLSSRFEELLTLTGFVCPTTATWIWSTTRIPALLEARPA